MYKSRSAQKRRKQLLIAAIIGAVLLGALTLGILAIGSSGSEAAKASGCAILDVSESTRQSRGVYTEEFAKFATDIGNDGTGKICVILAAADPLAEAVPLETSIAPLSGNVGTPEAPVEIEEGVLRTTQEVAEILEHPGIDEKGSGLVEAANVAAKRLQPGDRLIFLSDGLQWSKGVGHLIKMDLSPSGINKIITHLRDEHLLPNLKGVQVEFPLMLYRPEGIEASPGQKNRIPAFWQAWARATRADITFVLH
jgi:hypothetical protein